VVVVDTAAVVQKLVVVVVGEKMMNQLAVVGNRVGRREHARPHLTH